MYLKEFLILFLSGMDTADMSRISEGTDKVVEEDQCLCFYEKLEIRGPRPTEQHVKSRKIS